MRYTLIAVVATLTLCTCKKDGVVQSKEYKVKELVVPVVQNLVGKDLREFNDGIINEAELKTLSVKIGTDAEIFLRRYSELVQYSSNSSMTSVSIDDAETRQQCQDAATVNFVKNVFGVGLVTQIMKKPITVLGKYAVWTMEVSALLTFINDMNKCNQL